MAVGEAAGTREAHQVPGAGDEAGDEAGAVVGARGGDVVGDDVVRTYRVARFLAVDTAADGFERPAGFELAAYWQESTGRLDAALHGRPRG
ncbi:hypothetical protein [Streptomyces erythrochromogenes]|uniref:hypothetical protein n=1 Tax=Streptomyces erythrochromogenes TaxID=285574 RepID=UPI003F4DB180